MKYSRRRVLTFAAGVFTGIGGILISIPFFRSLGVPAFKTRDHIDIKIPKLKAGELTVVSWLNKPLFIYKRTAAQILEVNNPDARLLDPDSIDSNQPDFATNNSRSLDPEIFVAWGICTHLGCSVAYRPSTDESSNNTSQFLCPCHGAAYDLSGRVFKNMPAPKNLAVPTYKFLNESTIRLSVADSIEN